MVLSSISFNARRTQDLHHSERTVGIRGIEVEVGRDRLLLEGKRHLHKAGQPGGAFAMSEVGFDLPWIISTQRAHPEEEMGRGLTDPI